MLCLEIKTNNNVSGVCITTKRKCRALLGWTWKTAPDSCVFGLETCCGSCRANVSFAVPCTGTGTRQVQTYCHSHVVILLQAVP